MHQSLPRPDEWQQRRRSAWRLPRERRTSRARFDDIAARRTLRAPDAGYRLRTEPPCHTRRREASPRHPPLCRPHDHLGSHIADEAASCGLSSDGPAAHDLRAVQRRCSTTSPLSLRPKRPTRSSGAARNRRRPGHSSTPTAGGRLGERGRTGSRSVANRISRTHRSDALHDSHARRGPNGLASLHQERHNRCQ